MAAEDVLDLVKRETEGAYTNHAQRAAYRAGLSSAACICDALAKEYAELARTAPYLRDRNRYKGIELVLRQAGDLIDKAWGSVEVPSE